MPEIQRIFADSQLLGNSQPIELETIRWETHAWPDVGEDAQDVINKEIGDYDVLVGIMWKRFGTPTKRSGSGTGEEFERAYDYFKAYQRPTIMFYFRTTPFYSTAPSEVAQFQKVLKFRRKLEKLGVFFWEYGSPLQFERNVREHLIRQIRQWIKSSYKLPAPSAKGSKAKTKTPKAKTPAPVLTNPARIYLAYAREDLSIVRSIFYNLAEAGFQPWLDVEQLRPGQRWQVEVGNAISGSDMVLVFLSSHTATGMGYVQKEMRLALDLANERVRDEAFLIPVRLEPVEPPEELRNYQWIDYFADLGPERLMLAIKLAVGVRRRRGARHA